MTDPSVLRSIIANGGYTQLHFPKNRAFIDTLYGRILTQNPKYLLLENFDISRDIFFGYIVVLTETRQRLKKDPLVKQILKIKRRLFTEPKLPEFGSPDRLEILFERLRDRRETIMINGFDTSNVGRLIAFDNASITISSINSVDINFNHSIQLTDIASIEIQTPKLAELSDKIGG